MSRRSRGAKGERGSVGILFAAALLALGAGLACVSVYVARSLDYGRRVEAREALRQRLRAAADELVALIAADESPESDGPRDRAWASLGPRPDGVELRLRELSSRLDANLVPVDLLERTELRRLLAPGVSPADLAALREDKGLSTELGRYGELLSEDSLDSWTCFGWANANIVDSRPLRFLYESLCGDAVAAEAFSLRVAATRSLHRVIGSDGLQELLGSARTEACPVICVAAPHNANFLPEPILRAILSYPPLGLPEPAARAGEIVAARERRDLSEADLAALIGGPAVDGARPLALQYLGARSWFWEIEAEAEGRVCRVVAAVWPDEVVASPETEGARRLSVIETRFEP
jgi:hypothetical protein